jgi:hypothetical protein
MAARTQQPNAYSHGSGNRAIFKQINLSTDGTEFEELTGTDVLGASAGTWHDVGSLLESPVSRDDSGSHQIVFKYIEDDLQSKRLALLVAPFTGTAAQQKPEMILEDGTQVIAAGGNTEDRSMPFFVMIKREANGGIFYGIGQFKRSTTRPNKNNTANEHDLTFYTVDGRSYQITDEPSGSFAEGATYAALSGISAFGDYTSEDEE